MPRSSHFLIDKITNSIEESATGKNFETDMVVVTAEEIKTMPAKKLVNSYNKNHLSD